MADNQMGLYIQAKRKEKGLTQRLLAEQLNITDKAVSKWERGQGYPDIMMLRPLADALGVSVQDLLNTRDENNGESPAPAEQIVQSTIEYVDKVEKKKKLQFSQFSIVVLSMVLAVGMLTCIICDVAINRGLTWSIFPIASCVLAWCLIAPLLYFKKRPGMVSLLALTVLVLPFLFIIEMNVPAKGWAAALAVPVCAVTLAYLWIVYLCFSTKRLGNWFATAIAVLLVSPLEYLVNTSIDTALGLAPRAFNPLVFAIAALAAVILASIGVIRLLVKRNKA